MMATTWITDAAAPANDLRHSGIYSIVCLVNQKRYIGGASVSIHRRWGHHKGRLRAGRHANRRLQSEWDTYGESSFVIEVLEHCGSATCLEREQFWLDLHDATNESVGYNISPTAGTLRGLKLSREHKQKISLFHRGKPLTPEHREKVRQALLGKKQTQEHIENARLSRIGKPRSLQTRERIRLALLGRPCPEETKEKIRRTKMAKRPEKETL